MSTREQISLERLLNSIWVISKTQEAESWETLPPAQKRLFGHFILEVNSRRYSSINRDRDMFAASAINVKIPDEIKDKVNVNNAFFEISGGLTTQLDVHACVLGFLDFSYPDVEVEEPIETPEQLNG